LVRHATDVDLPVATRRSIIAVMVTFWIIALFGGASRSTAAVLEVAFTPAALATALWLWRLSPGAYLSFVWQLFFFTCLIRRLADLRLGWNAVNPIIVAPYLSALWCGFSLSRPSRVFLRGFGLILLGLLWAMAIGVVRNGIPAAGFAMLEWGIGPLLAAYLLALPRDSDWVNRALLWTAIVGVIGMASYGIVQCLAPAPWDRYWILQANMAPVIGLEPGRLRIFSTMNSPWPFGMTLMALLVFLIGSRGRPGLRALAIGLGLVALIGSQTRAAWGGLVAGWILLVIIAGRARGALLIGVALLALIGGLTVMVMPSAPGVTARIQTLGSLSSDDSLYVRVRFYQSFFAEAMEQPIGAGLGRTGVATRLSGDASMLHFDSGLMNVPFVLGWVGAGVYIAGLAMMIVAVARRWRQLSPPGLAAAAGCFAVLSQLIFLNSLIAATGVVFWTLLGVCLKEVRDQSAEAISRRKSVAGK